MEPAATFSGSVLLHGANGSSSFACLSAAPAPARVPSGPPSLDGSAPDEECYYIVDEEPGTESIRARRRTSVTGPSAMDGRGWRGGAALAQRLLIEEGTVLHLHYGRVR